MNTKTKNTKTKIINTNLLPSIQNLLVDAIIHTADHGYDFAEYYKEDVNAIPGLKNLSWENIITIGKVNIGVIIDAIQNTLDGAKTTVETKFGSSNKEMRPLKTALLKSKYSNALKKLKTIAQKAEYKPLLAWFRTKNTYNMETVMMYYSDILGHWDVCAVRYWHQPITSIRGYRYMPACMMGLEHSFGQDNWSLFMSKESNKFLSREELAWFASHMKEGSQLANTKEIKLAIDLIDEEFIRLWFAASGDCDLQVKIRFETIEEFADTIANNGAPDEEFAQEQHKRAHENYATTVAKYKKVA